MYCVPGRSFVHTEARWQYLHSQSKALHDVPSAGWMHDGWRFYDLPHPASQPSPDEPSPTESDEPLEVEATQP